MNRPTQQRRTTAADLHIAPGTHVTAKVAAVWDGQVITRTVRFPETSVAGEPITTWAPKSGGAQAYRALACEVIDRFGK